VRARLPVPCPLQPGESLPGLFSRAVVKNYYSGLSQVAPLFGLPERPFGLQRTDMRQLALGNADIKQIASFTEHTPEQIERAALRLAPPRPGGRYDEYVSIHRWRYCPACLREGKPHLRLWLLPFVTACTEHGCELVDACRACGHPNAVNLPVVPYCYGCQALSEVRPAHSHEIACSEELNRHIDDPDALNVRLDRLMTAWYLSTSEALRPHFRFSPQLQTVADMRSLVIRLWPAATSTAMLTNAIETQIETLIERWPYLPSIPTMLVERAKKAGATLPRRDMVEQHIELLQAQDPWWVPLSAAAEAAGISDHIMKRLVDAKLVRSKLFSEIGEDGSRYKYRMVNLDHWHQLITGLFRKAEHVETGAKLTQILRLSLDEVIRDVNRGKMSVFVCEGNTLADLMVRFKETREFSRKQQRPAGTLTSAEVCRLLGTYHAVVADLVEREIIKTHHKSHWNRLLIDQASALAFNEEYILVGTLAKQHGLNGTNLAEKLVSVGVSPAPIEALVTIYRRVDVVDVDFDSVRTIEVYQTKTGRKPTVRNDQVDEPRLKKLIELMERHDGLTRFCRKFDYSMGTLSSILHGKKTLGTLAAKRMEKRCGLSEGYFSE
jgi:hypothetical protein